MQQLELFENEVEISSQLQERIRHFQKLIDASDDDLELVAVNKMYESVVVYKPDNYWGTLQRAIERNGQISCEYSARGRDGLGTNYLILNERFKGHESITLYKKNDLIGCNVKKLGKYLADGWKIHSRGGVAF